MTPKAIILGLVGACIICGFTYFNDAIMRQTFFVGNNMPLSVYGGMILFVLILNPMLAALGKPRSRSVTALVVGLTCGTLSGAVVMAACWAARSLGGADAGVAAGLRTAILAGLPAGVLAGIVAGVVAALLPVRLEGSASPGYVSAFVGLASGLAAGLVSGVAAGLTTGLAATAAATVVSVLLVRLTPKLMPETVSRRLGELAGALAAAAASGLVAALASGLVAAPAGPDVGGAGEATEALYRGLRSGAFAGIAVAALATGLVAALSWGEVAPAVAGLAAALVAGVAGAVAAGPVVSRAAGIPAGLLAAATAWYVRGPFARRADVFPPLAAGLVAALACGGLTGLVAGVASGPAAGGATALVAGVLLGLVAGPVAERLPAWLRGPVGALSGALVGGLVVGTVAGPLAAAFAALGAALIAWLVAGRLAFSGRELAVVLALTLASCCIPGSGLLRTFTTSLMIPHREARTQPGWKEDGAIDLVPKRMLAGVPPRLVARDIVDPCGLCIRLAEDGPGGAPSPARRVWSLLADDERAEMRSLAKQAREPPTKGDREGALAATDAALARVQAAAVAAEAAAAGAAGDDTGAAADAAAARERAADAVRKAVADVLAQARPIAADRAKALRELDALMVEHELPAKARLAVAEAAREVLARHDDACRGSLLAALNARVASPGFHSAGDFREDFRGVALPKEAEALLERRAQATRAGTEPEDAAPLSGEETRKLNRHLVDAAFPKELRSLSLSEDYALNGFTQGLAVGREHIGFFDVPWHAWSRTLWFWVPLILLLWISLIALSVVVHRQWSTHEQLPYPIARFADSLLPREGRAGGGVLGSGLFWIGACAVLALHLNNYAFTWYPDDLVQIPTKFDFGSLLPRRGGLSILTAYERGNPWGLIDPTIYFTVVAFAYFLSTDVSLSLGIGPHLYVLLVGVLAGYGISAGGGSYLSPNIQRLLMFGAYFGVLLTIIYAGRRYYASVFRRAAFVPSRDEVEPHAVWAGRVFLLTLVAFIVSLAVTGLDWQLAVLYSLGTVALFLVMGRIVAETGLFFIQPYWMPCAVLAGLLGVTALGPRTMAIMMVLTTVFMIDPREALMPFVVDSLRLLDMRKVRIGRAATLCGAAVILGLAVGLPLTLYLQYDGGANMADGWSTGSVPRFAFEESVRAKQRLMDQGRLETAEQVSGWRRLLHVSPRGELVLSFAAAAALVVAFTAARWRFNWWPFHPVLFLVWSSYPARCFGVSFLVGWFIKLMVTKYGGEVVYRRLMPLMFGLIAGDMLGGVIPSIVGLVYYLITGDQPKRFGIMPG